MGEVKDYDESMFKASVGEYGATRRQCFNTVDDQTMVRDLLNAIPEWKGGTGGKLHGPLTWGIVRDDIYRAIVHFQNVRPEIPSVDGHVDPHEKTIRLLLQLAKQEPPVPPRAPVMPEVPPNVGPDPRNDPNTVFAGSNFQIKVLSGVSGGEVGGAFRYAFMIWDLDNNRAAKYSYQGVMTTWGSPVSISGAGAWSKPFTTPDAIQVDQFGGSCAHAAGGLSAPPPPTFPGMPPPMSPPSFMGVTLSPVVAATNMKWAKRGVFVNVPTGSGVIPSLGVEGGDGPFVLVGSAFIFSGP